MTPTTVRTLRTLRIVGGRLPASFVNAGPGDSLSAGRRRIVADVPHRPVLCSLALLVLAGSVASSAASRSTTMLPPPRLRASPGWFALTTGPTDPAELAPQVWAVTARSDTAALVPFDVFNGLRKLEPNGIVIWASTERRVSTSGVFTPSAWPPRLRDFRVDRAWEGQPNRNVQQRLRWTTVHGWRLDVRVYFGTQHPSRRLLAEAQAELNRLQLP